MKQNRHLTILRRYADARLSLYAFSALLLTNVCSPVLASAAASTRQEALHSAAQEFQVPENILSGLAYNESRFEPHRGQASNDNGYGMMNLRAKPYQAHSNKDGVQKPVINQEDGFYTLDLAAKLTGQSPESIKNDDLQNARGAAAVLAQYARELNGGNLPGSDGDWYAAVAKYSGSTDAAIADQFASNVYSTANSSMSITTSDHQTVTFQPRQITQPNKSTLAKLHLPGRKPADATPKPECPGNLDCRFVPAAYTQNNPADPTDYGNYDYANRPKDMKIKYIVIHDMEGSYDGSIAWFQNPAAYTSTQYLIRSSDGAITQMVQNKDVAWGAGDWYVNMHSINIEHEGFAAQGATWYTEAMYQSSAKLVRYLADKYGIPLDREHIIGHDNVPGIRPSNVARMHWDPGPYWDWNYYMQLIKGGSSQPSHNTVPQPGQAIIISPDFAHNQPTVQDCSSGSCVTLPAQGANFVYLHTSPATDAPLLSNTYLHPDNSPGSTNISDWSATASSGETYVVAEQNGDWTGIWYDGKIGWFYNPSGSGRNGTVTTKPVVKARKGLTSIPVYGGAYPEASAYPSTVPVAALTPLYNFPAGQSYAMHISSLNSDYYYAMTIGNSIPDDHTVIKGSDKFYQITYNHRIAYVRASDVSVQFSRP